jgi:hypothetical protein
MVAPTTTSKTNGNGLDPKKLDGVLDRMRDVQTEGDRWELAEALKVLVPNGTSEFVRIIDLATKEGVVGNLSANTLRLYRDTAARWPKSQRVENVSFSAHREAMALPGAIDGAARMLADIAKTQGAGKVTVASVRKAVAIKQGKKPTARQSGGRSNATGTPPSFDALNDLERNRGAGLVSAIGNETNGDRLDRLNAGLTKVIAHVEKLRAKAAAKSKTPTKSTTPPASKPKVGTKPVAKKAAGDMRGL